MEVTGNVLLLGDLQRDGGAGRLSGSSTPFLPTARGLPGHSEGGAGVTVCV